jgi:hypothetical protein
MIDNDFEALGRAHQAKMRREALRQKALLEGCARGHSWYVDRAALYLADAEMVCRRCGATAPLPPALLGKRGERPARQVITTERGKIPPHPKWEPIWQDPIFDRALPDCDDELFAEFGEPGSDDTEGDTEAAP